MGRSGTTAIGKLATSSGLTYSGCYSVLLNAMDCLFICGFYDGQEAVTVVGYPLGGDTISVTKGVVSRIEV